MILFFFLPRCEGTTCVQGHCGNPLSTRANEDEETGTVDFKITLLYVPFCPAVVFSS